MLFARVLYVLTQVSRKRKNRSYNDGFLNVTLPTTSGGRRATLLNECAVTLGIAVLPASLELCDELEGAPWQYEHVFAGLQRTIILSMHRQSLHPENLTRRP